MRAEEGGGTTRAFGGCVPSRDEWPVFIGELSWILAENGSIVRHLESHARGVAGVAYGQLGQAAPEPL